MGFCRGCWSRAGARKILWPPQHVWVDEEDFPLGGRQNLSTSDFPPNCSALLGCNHHPLGGPEDRSILADHASTPLQNHRRLEPQSSRGALPCLLISSFPYCPDTLKSCFVRFCGFCAILTYAFLDQSQDSSLLNHALARQSHYLTS